MLCYVSAMKKTGNQIWILLEGVHSPLIHPHHHYRVQKCEVGTLTDWWILIISVCIVGFLKYNKRLTDKHRKSSYVAWGHYSVEFSLTNWWRCRNKKHLLYIHEYYILFCWNTQFDLGKLIWSTATIPRSKDVLHKRRQVQNFNFLRFLLQAKC